LKAGGTGAGILFVPKLSLMGADAPSNKLNIAFIGVGGRGKAHRPIVGRENVVAICDINDKNMAPVAKMWPKAKVYHDWRKCLDQKDVDTVLATCADHVHAFIGTWALNRDLHIYLEKPIGITIEECRVLRQKYLEKKNKCATQLGMQRHAYPNFNRLREMVLDGAVGDLKDAYAWGSRKLRRPGYLPAAGDPPAHIHYDLWIGPSPMHPFNPGYFGNCLSWNMYWDFGTGQIGDMGAHTMDLAWNCLDAGHATAATAKGEPFNPEVTPVELEMHMEHPANKWRGPIKVHWYQGGAMPNSPSGWTDLSKIGHGVMFKGDKGFIVADFNRRHLIPFGDNADLSYYKPRPQEKQIPKMGGFHNEWLKACKGDTTKTSCNFDYSGLAMEQMLLGLIAYRVGQRVEYDGKAGKITNSPEGDALIRRKYRKGWVLDG
jgi:predicted dehydrogenase